MTYRVTVQPDSEPLTLDEAREHLRITPFGSPLAHPDDDLITGLIVAARQFCENYLQRALPTQTIQFPIDSFSGKIAVPLRPVQSIVEITYIDTNGAQQTLADTVYTLDEFKGEIVLKYGQRWPATRSDVNAVLITAEVGYTDGQSPDNNPIPYDIKSAMKLIIGNLYENRQQDVLSATRLNFNSLPLGVYALLQPYRQGLGV
jgi:uncharacterized phiE125 gp8 family phage protein